MCLVFLYHTILLPIVSLGLKTSLFTLTQFSRIIQKISPRFYAQTIAKQIKSNCNHEHKVSINFHFNNIFIFERIHT